VKRTLMIVNNRKKTNDSQNKREKKEI